MSAQVRQTQCMLFFFFFYVPFAYFIVFILFSFQYVTEKMGAAEGTKMDDDFVEMERVCLLDKHDFVCSQLICLNGQNFFCFL